MKELGGGLGDDKTKLKNGAKKKRRAKDTHCLVRRGWSEASLTILNKGLTKQS
jgi:hypothetical protein